MTLETKVGILVAAAIAIVAGMSFKVQDNPILNKPSHTYYGIIPNANGLVRNSHVKMAGLTIGYVEQIQLERNKAKLTLKIDRSVQLYKDAELSLRSMGVLGDKYVEVTGGTAGAQLMANGETFQNTVGESGIDLIITESAKTMKEIQVILADIQKALRGEDADNLVLGRILANIEDITQNFADISSDHREDISMILANLREITEGMGKEFNRNQDSSIVAKLNATMANVERVVARLERGEGTVGRLLRDEETVDRINNAVAGIQKFVSKADRVQTNVSIDSHYMVDRSDTRSAFGLSLHPSRDRSYYIQAVSTPEGDISRRTESVTANGRTSVTDIEVNDKNKLKLTAQFGKRFYDWNFRVGLTENTGGGGIDYFAFEDRVRLHSDVFRFGRTSPNIRLGTDVRFLKYFFGSVTGDDLLRTNGRDLLVGGGLQFNDDDIKSLLSIVSLGR